MYRQTIQLSESLPHFAAAIQAADRKGYSDWEIVRWVEIEPRQLLPHQVTVVRDLKDEEGNIRGRFPSRSPALLFSAWWLKNNNVNASLDADHWGVWYYKEDGRTVFQSVLPLRRDHIAPVECSNEPAAEESRPQMPSRNLNTRLSDASYHLLQSIAAEDNQTIRTVLEKAIQYYDHVRYFAISKGEYTAEQNDPDTGEDSVEANAPSKVLTASAKPVLAA